jgi:membrane protein
MSEPQVIHGQFGKSPATQRSWKQILWGTYQSISEDRVLAVAAGVTFYGLLALFPAVAALVSLYGLFADPVAIQAHLEKLSSMLPGGAVEIIGDQIKRVASAGSGTLGFSSAISIAIAVWGANAGVKAVFDALNVAYGAKEERSFIKLNLISLAFTIGAIAFAILAIAAVIVLPLVMRYVGPDAAFESLLAYGRWPLIWVIVALALATLYRFGPTNSLNPKWQWITWGSALASLLWLAASAAFSWYAANFGSYNATYGSLGAVIGLMTWMWISATVIMLGAELNSEIERAADEPHAQRSKSQDQKTRTA